MFDPGLERAMLWVPLSGPVAMALAWFIDAENRRLAADIEDLEKLRYRFKDI
jgi:hypothetical protein